MIGRDVEQRVGRERHREQPDQRRLHEPPAPVPLLGPGIGAVDPALLHTARWQRALERELRWRVQQEDVLELALLRAPRDFLDALARDLDAEKRALRGRLGQVEQELAAPEADLEHDALRAERSPEAAFAQRDPFYDRHGALPSVFCGACATGSRPSRTRRSDPAWGRM